MPGNKRPGGSHLRRRPRPRDPAAALRTIALNQQTHNRTPLAGDQLLTLALGYHSALNAVQHGAGPLRATWRSCCATQAWPWTAPKTCAPAKPPC
jgi:hypothetical protein